MPSTRSLTIRLLGRLEIVADGQPVRIGGRHAQALIALLALRPRLRLRDTLAAELWPDGDGPCAGALRQALWLVRSSFVAAGLTADDWLETDQDTLGLRREVRLDLDTDRFELLALNGEDDDPERAVALYTGDLLEGLGHECFAADRERFSDLYEDVLARVAESRLSEGDLVGARRAATELLTRDPLREEAHAALIAVYGQAGTRSQVVRQYRRLCAILRVELAVSPLPETDAVYRTALACATSRSLDRVAERGFDPRGFAPVPVLVSTA
jgi:DNA-binding SARP family transcriptional activator